MRKQHRQTFVSTTPLCFVLLLAFFFFFLPAGFLPLGGGGFAPDFFLCTTFLRAFVAGLRFFFVLVGDLVGDLLLAAVFSLVGDLVGDLLPAALFSLVGDLLPAAVFSLVGDLVGDLLLTAVFFALDGVVFVTSSAERKFVLNSA